MLGDFERENSLIYQGIRADMVRKDNRYWLNLTGAERKKQQLEIVQDRGLAANATIPNERRRSLDSAAGCLRSCATPLDALERLVLSCRRRTVHGARDRMEFELRLLSQRKAQPGFDWDKKSWNTEVAELGIACGACHGPTGEHAQRAMSPLTRYRWHFNDSNAAPIAVVNPVKIDSDRAAMICGHCHGQRLPDPEDRIRTVLNVGDPYNASENLRQFYKPVERDAKVGNFSFATRFWADGSPRLTAYEYQGLLHSKCFRAGKPEDTSHHVHLLSFHAWRRPARPDHAEDTDERSLYAMSSTVHEVGGIGSAYETHCSINRQPLLQLSHAADCFRHHVGTSHTRHHNSAT